MSTQHLLIGTLAHGGNVHCDYLHTIIDMHKLQIKFDVMTITNEPLISKGRNTILSYFIHEKKYTHLFFIDADVGLPANAIIKLIQHQKDVIGVPVPLKELHPNNMIFNTGEILGKEDGISYTNRLGTGIFMLSRKAVESLIEDAPTYQPSKITRGTQLNNIMYDVFRSGVVDNVYLSEDYFICHSLIQKEYKIFIDVNIPCTHNGNSTLSTYPKDNT